MKKRLFLCIVLTAVMSFSLGCISAFAPNVSVAEDVTDPTQVPTLRPEDMLDDMDLVCQNVVKVYELYQLERDNSLYTLCLDTLVFYTTDGNWPDEERPFSAAAADMRGAMEEEGMFDDPFKWPGVVNEGHFEDDINHVIKTRGELPEHLRE